MDQIKIGKFIANMRKERGLTQLRLAEQLGVSDKTVSKWECGNGLPEISALIPLCEVLSINVNELLSGERLSQENYSQKAEENMMHLIRQTEDSKKRDRNIGLVTMLALAAMVAVIIMAALMGSSGALYLLDFVSLLLLSLSTTLLLLAAGLWKDFWRALRFVFRASAATVRDEVIRAREAVDLTARSMLFSGILAGVLGLVQICVSVELSGAEGFSALTQSIAVALLAPLYGLIVYCLLMPIRSRLDIQTGRCKETEREQR